MKLIKANIDEPEVMWELPPDNRVILTPPFETKRIGKYDVVLIYNPQDDGEMKTKFIYGDPENPGKHITAISKDGTDYSIGSEVYLCENSDKLTINILIDPSDRRYIMVGSKEIIGAYEGRVSCTSYTAFKMTFGTPIDIAIIGNDIVMLVDLETSAQSIYRFSGDGFFYRYRNPIGRHILKYEIGDDVLNLKSSEKVNNDVLWLNKNAQPVTTQWGRFE